MGAVAAAYAGAGAAAISVLTDGRRLRGLAGATWRRCGPRSTIPVLRKDFTVDPVQVAESRVLGADWVLLIVAVLEGGALEECLEAVRRAGAQALVEVHDEPQVERALAAGATCVGINNRDLRSLRTDLDTFSRLRRLLPDGVVSVAESGVRNAADVARLVGEGADAVLVGEALMRHPDPGPSAPSWWPPRLGRGRRAATSGEAGRRRARSGVERARPVEDPARPGAGRPRGRPALQPGASSSA